MCSVNFPIFPPGTLLNPLDLKNTEGLQSKFCSLQIRFPARINAMAIDPSLILPDTKSFKYSAGEILFSVGIYTIVDISLSETDVISGDRSLLIEHALGIMRKTLKFSEHFTISVTQSTRDIKHAGLGTSSRTIIATMVAINEIYDKPLTDDELVTLASENHGEESSLYKGKLQHVQSIGGSACSGIYPGGFQIIAGRGKVIFQQDVDSDLVGCFILPHSYSEQSLDILISKEEHALDMFYQTGKTYGREIVYNIVHDLMPSARAGDWSSVGDVIWGYRKNMGSIKNCSFIYEGLENFVYQFEYLKQSKGVLLMTLSSVGPGLFFLLEKNNISYVESELRSKGCTPQFFNIENSSYHVRNMSNSIVQDSSESFWQKLSTVDKFVNKSICKYVKAIYERESAFGSGMYVCDVGFGGGRNVIELINSGCQNIFGIDTSNSMIDQFQSYLEKSGKAHLSKNFSFGDIQSIGYADNNFDITISTGVVHQFANSQDYRNAIFELSRITKIGGIVYLNVFTNHLIDVDLHSDDMTEFGYINQSGLVTGLISCTKIYEYLASAGLEIKMDSIINEITDIGYAKRSILRLECTKVFNPLKILLVTGNKHKLQSAQSIFDNSKIFLVPESSEYEIQGNSSMEVAQEAAMRVARQRGLPAIREDHALYIEGIMGGKFPGPYTSYFDKNVSVDDFVKIIFTPEEIKTGVKKAGYFELSACLAFPDGTYTNFVDRVGVEFISTPQGERGNLDKIIMLPNADHTFSGNQSGENTDVFSNNFRAIRRLFV